jgi:hypothetical protein
MQFVRAFQLLVIIALLMAGVAGCTAEAQRYIRFPNFTHPGPAPLQRAEAIQHDPYPLPDIAPEIEGGRPREYQQPVNEVDRAHLVPTRPVIIQPLPAPGTTVVAPPVVSSPYAVAPPQPAAPLMPAPVPVVTGTPPPVSAPIVTSPYPAAPAPVAAPYPATPAPMVTSPYPAATTPLPVPYPSQQRAPY